MIEKSGNIYYREITEDELSDIYDIKFEVCYDTGLDKVPVLWAVTIDSLVGEEVRLRFSEGILPGWEVEEKNVCTKLIEMNDITMAKAIYTYKKRDGKMFNSTEEIQINVTDIMKMMNI